jgi:hypothetical protein
MSAAFVKRDRLRFLAALITIVVVQFISRYLPTPATGFVADDWGSLHWGRTMSWATIAELTRDELDRPLCMFFIPGTFKLLDDSVVSFAVLNVIYNSLTILLFALLVYRLTRSQAAMITSSILFALLPNITESFHWAHHTAIGFVHLGYVLSMFFGVLYIQKDARLWHAFAAALSYAVALFAYESGALLPLALLAFYRREAGWRYLLRLWPFALVIGVYVMWRSGLLGATRHILNFRDYLDQSFVLANVVYNAGESLAWWAGKHLLWSISQGLDGYMTWPTSTRIALTMVNLFVIAWAYFLLMGWKGTERSNTPEHVSLRVYLFALLWFLLGLVPSVVAWPAGRLNYMPGLGMALLVSLIALRWDSARTLLIVGLLMLFVNQGTTKQWYDSGIYQARMYDHLQTSIPQWIDQDLIFIDTTLLRQRQTRGLLRAPSSEPYSWSMYGNAVLARSFVPHAITDLLVLEHDLKRRPRIVLDVEYTAEVDGDHLVWHGRFHRNETNRTHFSRIYTIDALLVGYE